MFGTKQKRITLSDKSNSFTDEQKKHCRSSTNIRSSVLCIIVRTRMYKNMFPFRDNLQILGVSVVSLFVYNITLLVTKYIQLMFSGFLIFVPNYMSTVVLLILQRSVFAVPSASTKLCIRIGLVISHHFVYTKAYLNVVWKVFRQAFIINCL